jgi:hypothetical protein
MVSFVAWVSGIIQPNFCAFLCFSRVHCIFFHCVCVCVCVAVYVCVRAHVGVSECMCVSLSVSVFRD